jgi:hypothetical protein
VADRIPPGGKGDGVVYFIEIPKSNWRAPIIKNPLISFAKRPILKKQNICPDG